MNKIQKIIIAVCAVVLVALIITIAAFKWKDTGDGYTPPPHDASAVQGTVKGLDNAYGYSPIQLPISDEKVNLWMSSRPKMNGGYLELYFTSEKENTAYTRIIVYGANGETVGESGLVNPGEYVQSVKLSGDGAKQDTFKVKILTYAKDTYYSLGTATVELKVQ